MLEGYAFFSALLRHLSRAMMGLVLLMACGPGRLQAAPVGADAVVLVNSNSASHVDFHHFIKPYLDNFGVPYTILDISTNQDTTNISNISNYAVIIIGHANLDTNGAYLNAEAQRYLTEAVSNGTGLVSFDAALFADDGTPRYDFSQSIFGFTFTNGAFIASTNVGFPVTENGGTRLHFITALHTNTPPVTCHTDTSLRLPGFISQANVTLVATNGGGAPLVAVTRFGQGRAVQWTSYGWVAPEVIGPLGGLDDLVWRCIVWAARKPFVMRGLPNFVTLRFDDVSGVWSPPLWWAHTATNMGFKPWLGLFLSDIVVATNSDSIAGDLAQMVTNGLATANIHAWNATSYFWFDDGQQAPFSYNTIIYSNLNKAADWFTNHGILPPSKVLVAHASEMGENAFPDLRKKLGVEFPFLKNPPGTMQSNNWLQLGPYRRYGSQFSGFTNWPVFYADFLTFTNNTNLNWTYFNCGTEIRDAVANEWFFENMTVPEIIRRGTEQVKVALDSMALATLYTHEQRLRYLKDDWQNILQTIKDNLVDYHPLYVTLDDACQYVRATRTSRLVSSTYEPDSGQVNATFAGTNDLKTYVYTFIGQDNGITALTGINAAFTNDACLAGSVSVLPPGVWVQFSQPVEKATFTTDTGLVEIDLQACALTSTGSVSQVEFFSETSSETNRLGAVTAAPYKLTWTNVPPGTYAVRAHASNSVGQTADSRLTIKVVGPVTRMVNAGELLLVTNTVDLGSLLPLCGTNLISFNYPDRSALTNDGWSFWATNTYGQGRNTENTNPPSFGGIDYDQSAGCIKVPCDKGDLWDFPRSNNTTNSLFRDLPTNWVRLQLTLSFAPTNDFQQVHLSLYQNDDQYVQVGVAFHKDRGGTQVSVGYQTNSNTDSMPLDAINTSATDFVFGATHDLTNNTVTWSWGTGWTCLVSTNLLPPSPRLAIWAGGSTIPWSLGMPTVTLSNLVLVTNVPRVVTYTLLNPPSGAAIDSNGIITWMPSETQGPGTYTLTSVAEDNGMPPCRVTNKTVVVVNKINTAPVLNAYLSPSNLVLSWTNAATNFVLESATNLALGTPWTPVTNATESAAGTFSVPLVPDAPQRFFRLHLNP